MNEALYDSAKKCGECAFYNTDFCYMVTYVDEDHYACDEFIAEVENESKSKESKGY